MVMSTSEDEFLFSFFFSFFCSFSFFLEVYAPGSQKKKFVWNFEGGSFFFRCGFAIVDRR